MKDFPTGRPIRALDVAAWVPEDRERGFVRLCNALVAVAREAFPGQALPPRSTERVNAPDQGADALMVLGDVPETEGLIGPGRTVYQYKWRDLALRNQKDVLHELEGTAREELAKEEPGRADRYVWICNLDLTGAEKSRIEHALRQGNPGFERRPVVVWGASEIASLLNVHPHLRHAFFSDLRLSAWDAALDGHLRLCRIRRDLPAFVDREEEGETIARFLHSSEEKVLRVWGPAGIGKTRLVLEALEPFQARVLWAASPEDAPTEVLRSLQDGAGAAPAEVLVVDECDAEGFRRLREEALRRNCVKTILIGSTAATAPRVTSLEVKRLDGRASASILDAVAADAPFRLHEWLSRSSSGVPGVLIPLAQQASTLPEGRQLPEDLTRWIAQEMLRGAGDNRRALEVLSLLPAVRTEGEAASDVKDLCAVMEADEGEVLRAIPDLEETGLLVRRGRFVQVRPQVLADRLAAEALRRRARRVIRLLTSPRLWQRFLPRLVRLAGTSLEADEVFDEIFSEAGWFPGLGELERLAAVFRTLAPARPAPAAARARAVLEGAGVQALGGMSADALAEILIGLGEAAVNREAFEDAFRAATALARREAMSGEVEREFAPFFYWGHPEVAVGLRVRLSLLEKSARSSMPEVRALVGRCCRRAFDIGASSVHLEASGAVPQPPALPATWDEVGDYVKRVLRVLETLLGDSDASVREAACEAVLGSGALPFRLDLDARILDLLRRVARLGWQKRGDVLQHLGGLSVRITEKIAGLDARAEAGEERRLLRKRKTLDDSSRKIIEEAPQADRLRLWVGRRILTDPGERVLEECIRLARAAARKPDLLAAADLAWLASDEAELGARFLEELGRRDTKRAFLTPLQEMAASSGEDGEANAFAHYLRGMSGRAPTAVALLLSRMEEDPRLARTVVRFTLLRGLDRDGIALLRRLVARGDVDRVWVARRFAYGWRTEELPDAEFGDLLEVLLPQRGLSVELAAALLDMLHGHWRRLSERRPLLPLLRRVLERSLEGVPLDTREFQWDEMAAEYVRLADDPGASAGLYETVLRSPRRGLVTGLREFFQAVRRRVPAEDLAERLLRLGEDEDASIRYAARRELAGLVRPDPEDPVLRRILERTGLKGAVLVAEVLSAGGEAFWTTAAWLIGEYEEDSDLLGALGSSIGRLGPTSSLAEAARGRLKQLIGSGILEDPQSGAVRSWAREVQEGLRRDIARYDQMERERYLPEYDLSRSEMDDLLATPGPNRDWALRRLLRDASVEEVWERVKVEDVRYALDHLDLPEDIRERWEGELARATVRSH